MPVVGKYKQGAIITHAPAQPDEAGTPSRAPESAPAPKGEANPFEGNKTVGANPRKAH